MSSKNKVASKKLVATSDLISFLENMMAGMKSRNVVIECGTDIIKMDVADEVKFEIEAKQKKEKHKISLEISWEGPVAKPEEILKIAPGDVKPVQEK